MAEGNNNEARTYSFYAGDESIDGSSGGSYLANQTGLVEGATEEDIRAYWNTAENLQDQFGGDWDKYMAYMNERQDLIDSGEYEVGSYGQIVETSAVQNVDGTMIEPSDIQNLSKNDFIAKYGLDPSELQLVEIDTTGARSQGFTEWSSSDAVVALNKKYGIDATRNTDDGRGYQWNGTAYVKIRDKENFDFGTFAKMAITAAAGAALTPALAAAMGGSVAATSAAAGIVNSALSLSQGEGLDLKESLKAALTAGAVQLSSEALNGLLDQAGELESGLSDEIRNSLEIIRENNPERFQELMQQGGELQQILSGAVDAGQTVDQLANILQQGGQVGGIVWDAIREYEAAGATVDDEGNYVFEGSDVAIDIPDYSVIAETVASDYTLEEVLQSQNVDSSEYSDYIDRMNELNEQGINGQQALEVLVEEGILSQQEYDSIVSEVDNILAENEAQAANENRELVVYTGDSELVKDGVWEPTGINRVRQADGTYNNVFVYEHKDTGEIWEIPEEELGTYGGTVVDPSAYENTAFDPDQEFDEFEQRIWDLGTEGDFSVEEILQDIQDYRDQKAEEPPEEVVDDILEDTTDDDGEEGGGFTFGGGALVKDLLTNETEPEQKDKEASEDAAKDAQAEQEAKDAQAEQEAKDAQAEQEAKDVQAEQEAKDAQAEETAKDVAEQLAKDSNDNDSEGGLTFGGAATKDETTEETTEETTDQGGGGGGGRDITGLFTSIFNTVGGGGGGGEDPGDLGFTFGGGSSTKDSGNNDGSEQAEKDSEEATKDAEEAAKDAEQTEKDTEEAEKDSEETEPAGQGGLTFGGGSVVKDTKDGTGSSSTEGGKDGGGSSDTEGGKDGTGDSDTEGGKDGSGSSVTEGGEEEAMSLFSLTKDAKLPTSSVGKESFKPFTAGIDYESPTAQSIVQSPNVDYMAKLNNIINKGGMLV
jgi:hypothetical protein